MPSAVAEYLSELSLRLETHLERRLAGAWLVGSGALGDFDTLRSDVDVQAVCTTRLGRAELGRLVAALSHPALRCPVRGLEFVLYAREDLSDSHAPAFQLNLNTGPRMEHHVGYDPEAVLPACRAGAWATQGRWLSKGDAAAWAVAQLPDPAPVAKALARRADPTAPGPTASEVEGLLEPVERLLHARANSPVPS